MAGLSLQSSGYRVNVFIFVLFISVFILLLNLFLLTDQFGKAGMISSGFILVVFMIKGRLVDFGAFEESRIDGVRFGW